MISEQRKLIKKYLDILLRRKSILIFFIILGTALGLGLYIKEPKIYQSAALLKYQRQTVNPTRMSPDDLRTRTTNVVETVKQQIMSRTSLEELIKQFDLYSGLREKLPMEDIVDIMRLNHIETQLAPGGDVFYVSYKGSNQDKVMKVTNALAARFIEENLRFRQERASQTSTYIRDELEMAKLSLDEKEQRMMDYKLQYYSEMPDQLANNTNRLNALQEQYQNNQSGSLELERTRLLVNEQIAQRRNILAQLSSNLDANNAVIDPDIELSTVQKIKVRLQSLQSRYTEKHPEVKRLRKILKDLESQQPNSEDNLLSEEGKDRYDQKNDPQIIELKQQLKDIEFNLNRLNKERIVLEKQIKQYEKWITAAPIREAEWSALTRDYDQFNEHYERLVTESLQAESAQSLENQLKGSQFKIVDSAHFPEKPFSPDFIKIMVIALGLSVGVGCIISLGLEVLNTSFKDPIELEDFLEVEVVCAVPAVFTKREIFFKRLKTISINLTLLISGLSLATAAIYLYRKGMIII